MRPDLDFCRAADAVVQWLHDYGISRTITLRSIHAMVIFSIVVIDGLVTAVLCGTMLLTALYIHERREASYGKSFNLYQLAMRATWPAFVRLCVCCFILGTGVRWADWSVILWVIMFYSITSLKPMEPPKHKLTFGLRRLAASPTV